jgi:iron complex transport system permease protein
MKAPAVSVLRLGRMSVRWRPRTALVCLALAAIALILAALMIAAGSLAFTPAQVMASLIGQEPDPLTQRVVTLIRVPRALTACLAGGALGMAGAIFQSISRNALGSPDIIGFTTGAATGALVQIILHHAGPVETSAAAVAGGMATAAIVFLLSLHGRRTGGFRLVLVGVGVGATLSGVNTVLLVMGDLDQAASAQLWLAGSLDTRTWSHVIPAALGFALVIPIVMIHARNLDLLEMGDDVASELGVPVERTRIMLVMAAVGLTSLATAAAGPIAFVALAAPQIARRLNATPSVPIVSGALMGMVLLMAADLVSQHLPMLANMPIGLTTSLLGGLYLLWLLARSKSV